jgi:hypothetical protein
VKNIKEAATVLVNCKCRCILNFSHTLSWNHPSQEQITHCSHVEANGKEESKEDESKQKPVQIPKIEETQSIDPKAA